MAKFTLGNLSGWLIAKLKRWLIYVVSFFVILAVIAIGSFYAAKPYLTTYAQTKMTGLGIKADTTELSLMGYANLTNVKIPTPKDILLKIGSMSARPPVAFIPGTATLYDVDLQRGNIHLQIPKISINGISLKDADSTIDSRILKNLMRVGLWSVNAPKMTVSLTHNGRESETIVINGFWLSDLQNGRIGSIGINGMSSNVDIGSITNDESNPTRIIGKSNALSARDIDIAYAYSIASGKITPDNIGRTVIGPVSLGDIDFDIYNDDSPYAHFSLNTFKTSGLEMRPMDNVPEELLQKYLEAKKTKDKRAIKATQNDLIVSIVSAITSIDAELQKANIELPNLKASLDSFQLTPKQWRQSVPESLIVNLNKFSVKTSEMPQENLKILENIGLDSIDLSGKVDFSFNSGSNILSLNTISFDIDNIGSGEISAKIVDVDPELFSGDQDSVVSALQKLGVTEVDMRYSDYGFIDKLFTFLANDMAGPDEADKQKLKEELYLDLYDGTTKSTKMLIKDPAQAEVIAAGFGDFAKNPKNLTITVRAKDRKGLTVDDLEIALQNDLATVLNKVNLTVKNQ